MVCVGSIDELAELSGVKVDDLHRERCIVNLKIRLSEFNNNNNDNNKNNNNNLIIYN